MKLLRSLPLLALTVACLSVSAARGAEDFVVDDGTSEAPPTSSSKIVLMNQTGQPKLKIFVSAKAGEKPKPQIDLKESDYTVYLSVPGLEVSLYVTTMDNKKKSAVRKTHQGDVLAVVFQDGGLAVLKTRK